MSDFSTKSMLPTSDGTPGPQYYNPVTNSFEVLVGRAGALAYAPPHILYAYEGSGNINPTSFGTGMSVLVTNDGTFDINLQINSMSFTIRPGEVFDENFYNFSTFTITTYSTYRLWVRGFNS